MGISYSGSVNKKNYFSREKMLYSELRNKGLDEQIMIYWCRKKQGPVAEVDSSRESPINLEDIRQICLNHEFILRENPKSF